MGNESLAFLKKIIKSYRKRLLFTLHAVKQMDLPERLITSKEVRSVIEQKEVLEYYLDDPRGASCLMRGKTDQNRIIHVLCSPKIEALVIVTAYVPYPEEWKENFRVRR
ncbi:DUF4258 domain-containing protein [Candidatus Saganbacteria bacterium]|nr:DUF4258 domain-containing protein [Candidatus Saganbacteria bacterium]